MAPNNDSSGDTADGTPPRATRRAVLAATAGGLAGVTGVGAVEKTAVEQIRLDGEVQGWRGRAPAAIAGKTNPTLTLEAGTEYEVTWENLDGAPHNFVVRDEQGTDLVRTDIISEEGATQSVAFTASEEMAQYLCEVHPTTMRGDVQVTARTPTETPTETPEESPTATDTPTETETGTEEPTASFDRRVVVEERGDVARLPVALRNTDRARVVVGSRAVNYLARFTAVDGNGDGRVGVAFDTLRAAGKDTSGIDAVADADRIANYSLLTEPLPEPLDAAAYDLQLRVDGRLTDVGILQLGERSTGEAQSVVAPWTASPGTPGRFVAATTPRSSVARRDWVAIRVNASGLYATLDSVDDLADGEAGLSMAVREVGAMNREPETVDLSSMRLVTRPARNRFFVAVDTAGLQPGRRYEGVFRVTDRYPYVDEGDEEVARATFDVVRRTAAFDTRDGRVVVRSSDGATVSGRTPIAPGTTLFVSVRRADDPPFLMVGTTTVAEDGTWSVAFDFSDVPPGTSFQARVVGVTDYVPGVVEPAG